MIAGIDVIRAMKSPLWNTARPWWQRFLARVGRSDSRNLAGAGAHR